MLCNATSFSPWEKLRVACLSVGVQVWQPNGVAPLPICRIFFQISISIRKNEQKRFEK